MVTREAALVGRAAKMVVSSKHYVLFNQMEGPYPEKFQRMVFANGCFWGSEKGAWRLPGVYTTACGYSAGYTPNPTYEEVCSGRTGHTEVTASPCADGVQSTDAQRKNLELQSKQ